MLVVVLALVAASGSGPPKQVVAILRVPAAAADFVQLYDDGLYVWDNQQPLPETRVTSYDLRGRVRWSRQLPGSGQDSAVMETDRETVVDANFVNGDAHLIALDKRTGEVLWDRAATFGNGYPYVASVDPHGRILIYEAGRSSSRLSWLDTRTGKALWTEDLNGMWSPDFISDLRPGQRIWLVSHTGEVIGLRLADRVDEVTHMLAGLAPATAIYSRSVTARGSTILVTDVLGLFPYPQTAVLHAYDTATFAPRWTDTIGDNGSAMFCGNRVCSLTNAGVTLLDLATGRRLWTARSQVAMPIGDDLIVGPYSAPGAGPQHLVDGQNGRVIADLSSWEITRAGADALLLVQPTRGHLGIWLARLAAGASAPTLLTAVPGMSTRCQATKRVIACRAIDGTIAVWRTT